MTHSGALQLTTPSGREIMLTRVFDAPRGRVFAALTEPRLIARWLLGPPGWSMGVCEVELAVGGAYRYEWRHADGREMAMGGVYREIVSPERLVHTEVFDDPWYPGEALVTTELAERGGRTTLTATLLYESPQARDAVLGSGMEDGVALSYDRLAEVLASPTARPGARDGT